MKINISKVCTMLIPPHGGELISLMNTKTILSDYQVIVSSEIESDIYNIGEGVYSPLQGFIGKKECLSISKNMKLLDGTIWPIPILLDISQEDATVIETQQHKNISLVSEKGYEIAVLYLEEIFTYDARTFCQDIFGTNDIHHPAVERHMKLHPFFLSGKIVLTKKRTLDLTIFDVYNTPSELREIFIKKGFKKIVAFQTRNPPHVSHEYIQKKALESCDALLIQAAIGKKKPGDFQNKYILDSYKILLDTHYTDKNILLSCCMIYMRYAGPREAVLHAIIRQNFGCSHIIIGRDHAGVGNYYKDDEAQKIFSQFSNEDLNINICTFPDVSYCKACEKICPQGDCSHSENQKLHISGSRLRDMIQKKQEIPDIFMRKEISKYLISGKDQFIT